MNSRERVLTALRHEEPDRVPVDSGGCSATSISAVAYGRLKRHLGIDTGQVVIADPIQQLTMPEQWYLDRFGIDVVDVTREYALDSAGWPDFELADGSVAKMPPWINVERDGADWICRGTDGTILARLPSNGYFFHQTFWPMTESEPEEYEHPENYLPKTMWAAMPRPLARLAKDPKFPELLGNAAKKLHDETDYALMLNSGVSLYETAQFLRRTDNVLMDLAADRANLERLLDRILEMMLASLKRQLDAAGPYVQIVKVNDDLGMQSGLMFSPEMFREIFKPRYKALFDLIKSTSPGVYIFMHSCGSVYEVLGDLIDVGLDILNPVQTTAANMEPERLKREFGKHLTFWGGGVDTQHVLPFGTPEEVRADVTAKMRAFAPGGGFVFNESHNIVPGVPPENILAMFETVKELRDYPIR